MPSDEAPNVAAEEARRLWEAYFQEHTPEPRALAESLAKLHTAGKHEHVIAAIETALVHGQPQPWMYDVLALSMQIVKRPAADIERVLLSRIDFSAADVPSMIYSAAHLVRFGAKDRALALYKQATQLDPTRPEPYVLGLKLAREAKDVAGVEWAATGILTTVWGKDQKRYHDQARDAIRDTVRELRKGDDDDAAERLLASLAEAERRDLELSLTWSGSANLDLVVEEPAGTVCSFDERRTRGGGVLVHEGFGPKPEKCHEDYVCARGVPGSYRVRVRHLWGTVVGNRAKLTVRRYVGSEHESERSFVITFDRKEKIVRVQLTKGRRNELAEHVPAPVDQVAVVGRRMLGTGTGDTADARRALRRFQRGRAGQPGGLGYTPIVNVLSEGVTASAMAVVSGDRRYVRLTVAPSFNTITDVFAFPFQGGGANVPAGGIPGGGAQPNGGN